MEELTRAWRPSWPCPAEQILATHRRGAGDPTYAVTPGGHARSMRTPQGPVSLLVRSEPAVGTVSATAWGSGADWALDRLPTLLGAEDDPAGFEPTHPFVERAWRRHGQLRFSATGLVLESLVPSVIEQRVTGQEAFGAFRTLVRRFGEPAPGPLGLRLQPTPERLRGLASWEWLRLPVDGARSRPVVAATRVADALERGATLSSAELDRRLRSLPGIGVWTSAEVRSRVLGDADAVSFGDYHVAREVGLALVGAEVDDDGLAELLEPYRPHRGRVQQLVAVGFRGRPRRGPRMAPRGHLPG